MARKCGSCTVCCVVVQVDALGKSAWQPCVHLLPDGKGCGIYATRPDACRDFQCTWLVGEWGDHVQDRPDRLGAMVAEAHSPELGGRVVHAYEARPGSLRGERVLRVLRALVERVRRPAFLLAAEDGEERRTVLWPNDPTGRG